MANANNNQTPITAEELLAQQAERRAYFRKEAKVMNDYRALQNLSTQNPNQLARLVIDASGHKSEGVIFSVIGANGKGDSFETSQITNGLKAAFFNAFLSALEADFQTVFEELLTEKENLGL